MCPFPFIETKNMSSTIVGGSNAPQKSDGTITVGGTAQFILDGSRPAYAFSLFNNHPTEDLWFNDGGVAAIGGDGSVRVPPYGLYETPLCYRPYDRVSVVAATTGHKFTARYW